MLWRVFVALSVAATAAFLADVAAGPLFSLETKASPPQRRGDTLVGTLEGVVKSIDPQAGTVRVASGLVGVSSQRFVIEPQTRIAIDDKLGALADLERGQLVRVSYEVLSDRLLASRVKLLRRGMPETAFPSDPEPEVAHVRAEPRVVTPSASIAGARPTAERPAVTSPSSAAALPPSAATRPPSAVSAPSSAASAPRPAGTPPPSAARAPSSATTPPSSAATPAQPLPTRPRSLASDRPGPSSAAPDAAKAPSRNGSTATAKKPRVKPRVAAPRPRGAEPQRSEAAMSPPRSTDPAPFARERETRADRGLAAR